MSDIHSQAVEDAISAAGDLLKPVHGPLLGLVRALAEQMDATGPEGPGSRLSASYLSALKDFGKVATPPVKPAAAVDPVDELKARRRRRALDG